MAKRIAMLGAGSWGTALAIVLAKSGHEVTLWARRPEAAEHMRRHRRNPTYLPRAQLPDELSVTSVMEDAVTGCDMWVFATPSHAIRDCAKNVRGHASDDLLCVSVAKGIENNSLLTTTRVLHDVLDTVPMAHLGVLSGPSHAEEVAEEKPTTVVAAAYSTDTVHEIQSTFATSRLRVYMNHDVLGVEIAGSVKNVMAIGAGIGDGLGYGDNTKAAIVTRGLAEMKRLGLAMGAEGSTFSGLAGIGDLVVTCMSRHSRNRHVGELIGRGKRLEEVERDMSMVAEGVRTADSVHQLSVRYGIEMPITEAVYGILFDGKQPQIAVDELMTRAPKREDWLPDVLT
ncbi:MAG: NAD(P)H-dependent glycerol-3-phosphate dehydrogenase [Rhodothermales bacterium]